MTDQEVLQEAINRYGVDAQIDMAIEEMSELTKALLKLRRKNGFNELLANNLKEWIDVFEEIADVEIMIEQVKMIFDDDKEIERHRYFKINRLKERLGL